ncbi:hypothetical protein KSS87_003878 [Heliosperma pusillum]|nr:hypothetical protein KSS87_003878 [Heliosperma pusillum]
MYVPFFTFCFRDNNPLNLAELERLMLKLKGASARLGAALDRVRSEHFAMQSLLEPYIEILAQLRGEAPPVEGSDDE